MKQALSPIRSRRLLTLVALWCLCGTVALRSEEPSSPTISHFERDRARMILKVVRQDVEKYYYDPAYHGVDLGSSFAAASGRIDKAVSNGQLFAAIAGPLIELNDSHTIFLPPATSTRVDYGWHMMMVGDRCLVTAVEAGSDAAGKGLKRGDTIVSLDGFAPTRDNLDSIHYVYRALAPRRSVRLTIESPGSPARDVEIATKVEQRKRLIQLNRSADLEDYLRDIGDQAHMARHRAVGMGDALLVWKMPQFDLLPTEVRNDMRQVEKHEALILDLRGNSGGAVETLGAMVGSFLDGAVKIGDVQSRQRMSPIMGKAAGDAWKGKLIVLIDSGSASASELFARVMQLEKRATVIGDRSSGSVMMSRGFEHSIGTGTMIIFATSITIANIIMKDGNSLEHSGVEPDELLLPTPEDIAAGHDPVLTRAAALCGVALDPAKAGALFPMECEK